MIHVISSSGDWEIVKDETDGFIYKRKKRKDPCSVPVETPTSRSHDASKAAARKRAFLRRKKERLLAMKQMYISELAEWEELLNKQLALSNVAAPTTEAHNEELACVPPEEFLFELYKKLLHQVTGLELFIQQHEEFCDQVDKLCKEDYLSLLYNKDLLQTLQSPGQIFGNLCTDSV